MSIEKKTMLEAFKQKSRPTNFLTSFFRRSDAYMFDSETCEIDIQRDNRKIAIDVTPFTGGFHNVAKRWTTKEYKPPRFNEFHSYNGKEFLKRVPGFNPYDQQSGMAALIARIVEDQVFAQDKILRAIEKMSSDVFFTGQIALINDELIDFKQRTELQKDATAAWDSGSEDIPGDFEALLEALAIYGKVRGELAIFGKNAWNYFLASEDMQKRFNFRRVDLQDIRPPQLNLNGAVFHGVFSVGSYQLQAWTYPQFFDMPTDSEVGLPSGTLTNGGSSGLPFVPDNKVLVLPQANAIDLRLVFGGIPRIVEANDPRLESLGIPGLPDTLMADFAPYAYLDRKAKSLIVGVESAPLPVPTQIDGFGWIDVDP